MSNEELALMIQSGDQEQLPALWDQVKRLCYRIVYGYADIAAANVAVSVDDLAQEAYFAMVEAVERFQPEAGMFTTILAPCLKKRCRDALGLRGRIRYEHYRCLSLDAPIGSDGEGDTRTLCDKLEDDMLPGMTDALELEDLQHDVREAVDRLPSSRAEVIRQHYLQGMPLQEIAFAQGVNTQRIQQKKAQGLKLLRRDRALKDYNASCFRHKGVKGFNESWSSVVEDAVLQREAMKERLEAREEGEIVDN